MNRNCLASCLFTVFWAAEHARAKTELELAITGAAVIITIVLALICFDEPHKPKP